jgi:rhamnogalacturonan endolyase
VAFVNDAGKVASGRPSILMARGYAARSTLTAWNFRDGQLAEIRG